MRAPALLLVVGLACTGERGHLRVDDPANGVFRFDTPVYPCRSGAGLPEYGELRLRRMGDRWACTLETDGPLAKTLTLYESRDCPVREVDRGYCFDHTLLRDVVAEAAGRPAILALDGCVALEVPREPRPGPAADSPVEACRPSWTRDDGDVVAVEVVAGGTSKQRDTGEWLVCWDELGCDFRSIQYEVVFADGHRSPVSSSSLCMW